MQRHSKEDSMEKQPSNRAENQIRPFTVGRKNWLFFGALEGTRIPGPLIKRAPRAGYSDFETFEFTLFLCKAS